MIYAITICQLSSFKNSLSHISSFSNDFRNYEISGSYLHLAMYPVENSDGGVWVLLYNDMIFYEQKLIYCDNDRWKDNNSPFIIIRVSLVGMEGCA